LDLVGYRWADYDTPLWASPNRSPGRWHHAGDDPTQYWALHPAGPWAELVRANGIADPSDLTGIASRTWAAAFSFDVDVVAGLTFATAEQWGIKAADLVADDPTACRDLGRRLRRTYRALIVPSAALPGTSNLVVFGARVLASYGAPVVDSDMDVPSAPTADRGRPPAAVLSLVCHRGAQHAGLAAWAVGAELPAPETGW
jgi:hypothetical protein